MTKNPNPPRRPDGTNARRAASGANRRIQSARQPNEGQSKGSNKGSSKGSSKGSNENPTAKQKNSRSGENRTATGRAGAIGTSDGVVASEAAAQSELDSMSSDAPPQVETDETSAAPAMQEPSDGSEEPSVGGDGSEEPSVGGDGSEEPSVNAPPTDRPTGLKLLLHLGRPRATRAQLVVALLCGLLGFALVTQVHSQANAGLSSARQADLVDVLDNLSAKSEQLQSRIADEQRTLAKLTGGTGQTEAALQEAQQRATTLRILAGTIGATGPGVDLRIFDPGHNVTADVVLDTLEELRDAGAEAVEIRGAGTPAPAVRLVASSYFVDSQDGRGVIADGTPLVPPYDILAIGDPPTLAAAMGIPGGVLDTLKSKGAHGVVTELDTVRITSLHALTPPQYARPAASPSTGS